jgi:hypothetical protein
MVLNFIACKYSYFFVYSGMASNNLTGQTLSLQKKKNSEVKNSTFPL